MRILTMTIRVHAPLLARSAILGAGLLALAGCSNPYDPGQRALGGGLIGAGGGAAIGGLAGGGTGAAIGALTGGALGAATGAATTPNPPPRRGYNGGY
ncbi:cell envelope biogenesis protein OmpA [Nguyenibacter sp. L1]|uniref:cell envelope biogenesis protein OmpA n=1 Tax=Nguyenibacter sp. L1 TaxID=3049350 RepID=UPI002B4976FC|nr:cell envelope biogenesis protein OmpA [Nguyenibacter sp. L1]WRH88568.1 cell envelope biogenesis protein OmpA [Nguyenibacter sp. L1]